VAEPSDLNVRTITNCWSRGRQVGGYETGRSPGQNFLLGRGRRESSIQTLHLIRSQRMECRKRAAWSIGSPKESAAQFFGTPEISIPSRSNQHIEMPGFKMNRHGAIHGDRVHHQVALFTVDRAVNSASPTLDLCVAGDGVVFRVSARSICQHPGRPLEHFFERCASIKTVTQRQISLVERYVRDVEAGGSNPLTPTRIAAPIGVLFERIRASLAVARLAGLGSD